MCLSVIDKRQDPAPEEVEAWGCFFTKECYEKRTGADVEDPRAVLITGDRSEPVVPDHWLEAEEEQLWASSFGAPRYDVMERCAYTSGFHKSPTREDALKYREHNWGFLDQGDYPIIVRVTLRGVHTIGTQDGLKVLVAKEMLVKTSDIEAALAEQKGAA
jgi:hypothetical protein